MGGETEDVPDTQDVGSQSQTWNNIASQAIERIVWGRLYCKSIQMKSLGMKNIRWITHDLLTHFDLTLSSYSAGRAITNEINFKSEHLPENILSRISKVHFKIERDLSNLTNPVYIQDCSRNGTFVNGEKIGINNKRILFNDDVISLSHPLNKVFEFKDLCKVDVTGLPPEILTKYYISRLLGNGACGLVRLVYDRISCEKYAMKHVQKCLLTADLKRNILNDPVRVINEANIMKRLEHPCIIKMHDIVDKPDSVFMVLEYMKGGDLLNRIISKKRLSEKVSKFYFYQMCHAVKYLHEQGITHRDLKPDNILLQSDDEETLLKVSDFGLSKFVQKDSIMRTLCGTPLYVAPEVLLTGGIGAYTKKIDIWSLGVVLFTCLSGTLPFSDDYGSPATEQIKTGKFTFAHPSWKEISPHAKTLIREMLTVNPKHRPSIDNVLRHKWVQKDKDIIKSACDLMKIPIPSVYTNSDDENFLEPPIKRPRH